MLVFNHLEEVSLKLATKFAASHTFPRSSVKLQEVLDIYLQDSSCVAKNKGDITKDTVDLPKMTSYVVKKTCNATKKASGVLMKYSDVADRTSEFVKKKEVRNFKIEGERIKFTKQEDDFVRETLNEAEAAGKNVIKASLAKKLNRNFSSVVNRIIKLKGNQLGQKRVYLTDPV